MRFLIDGYNLMYAFGLLGRRLGPDGLRKVRHRFLNDLAETLGAVDAHQTTIVFDASSAPPNAPSESSHKGLTIIFAIGDESADDRIERLIAQHSAPKSLTVVSSDHRIQQAASRRKATAVSTDAFWTQLEARKHPAREDKRPVNETRERDAPVSPQESAFWLEKFRDLADEPTIRKELARDPSELSDDQIAEIEREVERESDMHSPRHPGRASSEPL